MNQRDQEAEHIESAEQWSIGERRNTEKAGESKTDVGSQDPSGMGRGGGHLGPLVSGGVCRAKPMAFWYRRYT